MSLGSPVAATVGRSHLRLPVCEGREMRGLIWVPESLPQAVHSAVATSHGSPRSVSARRPLPLVRESGLLWFYFPLCPLVVLG